MPWKHGSCSVLTLYFTGFFTYVRFMKGNDSTPQVRIWIKSAKYLKFLRVHPLYLVSKSIWKSLVVNRIFGGVSILWSNLSKVLSKLGHSQITKPTQQIKVTATLTLIRKYWYIRVFQKKETFFEHLPQERALNISSKNSLWSKPYNLWTLQSNFNFLTFL